MSSTSSTPNVSGTRVTHSRHGTGKSTTALMLVRKTIESAIRGAWSADTSADEAWSPQNPALGQCAVTALVVQDYLGGDLVRVVNDGVSHYFNRVSGPCLTVTEMDLTRDQFENWDPSAPEVRERDYVLSFPATVARYELLAATVKDRLTSRG